LASQGPRRPFSQAHTASSRRAVSITSGCSSVTLFSSTAFFLWRRGNDCPPPHVLRSNAPMLRHDYTDEVEDDHDRARSPRLCASEGIWRMTRITRESRGYVVSGPNRGEMQRYVLDVSSRVVHGDVNVVKFPRHTSVWTVSLRPSPPLTHVLLPGAMCVTCVFIVLYQNRVTHYSALRTGYGATGVITPDANLNLYRP